MRHLSENASLNLKNERSSLGKALREERGWRQQGNPLNPPKGGNKRRVASGKNLKERRREWLKGKFRQ